MINIELLEGMAFEVTPPSGRKLVLDTYPDEENPNTLGPTPMEMLQASAAVCTAMDVISILRKMKQPVESYRLEVESERAPEGQWPRPFTAIMVRHYIVGQDLDPALVEKAIKLSDEKYCSVMATLRSGPSISQEWKIENPVAV